jgi:hypothetical protein
MVNGLAIPFIGAVVLDPAAGGLRRQEGSPDGDGDGAAEGDRTESLQRLFDDRDVDGGDRDRSRAAYVTSTAEAGYLWFFDFDGDGDVDGHDNGQFNRRVGRS